MIGTVAFLGLVCCSFVVAARRQLAWADTDPNVVLIVGATGRTGSLVYNELLEQQRNVRALVRTVDKARAILNCTVCDVSEGIYVGDVRDEATLRPALEGVQTVVILSGVSGRGNVTDADIKEVEFVGVQNVVRALTQSSNIEKYGGLDQLRVVLCSSQGTTRISRGDESMFRTILFFKLNAEAFLGSVGFPTAIVKPCGLVNERGHSATLLASHDDAPTPTGSQKIPRADLARIMAAIVTRESSKWGRNLRFDICSIEGPATEDVEQLLESAEWGWEHHSAYMGRPIDPTYMVGA